MHTKRPISKSEPAQAAKPFFSPTLVYPKLTVNAPNDTYERQADAMANKVMRLEDEARTINAMPLGGAIQRTCTACQEEEENLQAKLVLRKAESGGGFEASPELSGQLAQSKGSGAPLPEATQAHMGHAFRADFSKVRVYTGGQAAAMSQSIQAKAFTHGSDIYFNKGQYQPGTRPGNHLLGHELTHVVQQGHASPMQQPRSTHKIQRDLLGGLVGGGVGMVVGGGIGAGIGFAAGGGIGALAGGIAGAGLGATIGALAGAQAGNAAAPKPNWTADDLKKMLKACDGGLGIWEKAKKANNDKDPTIVAGTGEWVDLSTGEITLDKSKNKCIAGQVLIQELSNLSRKADFNKATASALAGDLSRTDFIKEYERIEYDHGVKNVITAFDACKDIWGCKTGEKEWARKAKNFQDYYDNYLSMSHKENYGKWWDKNCKAAYDKKHATK